MIHVDFSAAEAPPDDWYPGVITGVVVQEIGATGSDGKTIKDFKPDEKGFHSITVDVTIQGGPQDGKEVRGWFKTTKKRVWQVADLYAACGIQKKGQTSIDPERDLMGKRLKFWSETTPPETPGDRPFTTINGVMPINAQPVKSTNGTPPVEAEPGKKVARD